MIVALHSINQVVSYKIHEDCGTITLKPEKGYTLINSKSGKESNSLRESIGLLTKAYKDAGKNVKHKKIESEYGTTYYLWINMFSNTKGRVFCFSSRI